MIEIETLEIETVEVKYNYMGSIGECETKAFVVTKTTVMFKNLFTLYSVSIPQYGLFFTAFDTNDIQRTAKALIEAHLSNVVKNQIKPLELSDVVRKNTMTTKL